LIVVTGGGFGPHLFSKGFDMWIDKYPVGFCLFAIGATDDGAKKEAMKYLKKQKLKKSDVRVVQYDGLLTIEKRGFEIMV
jgi:hypothetical protein